MDKTATATPQWTTKQRDYVTLLARDLGKTVDEALASIGLQPPLTLEQASGAIDQLKSLLDRKPDASATPPTGRQAYLTARNLKAIDEGTRPMPGQLDADAAWVLQRLAKLREIELLVDSPTRWSGANAGGPILVQHLVDYFGSPEQVAVAFGVSLGTVKGWGTQLPANRGYEAQVKTRGYVCA